MIGFGLLRSDWLRKWRESFSQSQFIAMQNQSNCEITFVTKLKIVIVVASRVMHSYRVYNAFSIDTEYGISLTIHDYAIVV